MSTKTKGEGKVYETAITAQISTGAIVRSTDDPEKVKEYTINAFAQSMLVKGIAINNIEVGVRELSAEEIAKMVTDPQNGG